MKKNVFKITFGLLISFMLISGSIGANVWTVIKSGGGDFTTITAAINAAANGDEINISAGIYDESIIVSKELTINGPFTSIAGYDISRGIGEAIIKPAANLVDGYAVQITANNVTIDGITVDGDMNCVDGILVKGDYNNIKVINNIVENLIYTDGVTTTPVFGIGGEGIAAISGNNEFSNNYLANIQGSDMFTGPAIAINTMNNFYADIKNNVMTNVLLGIVISSESSSADFVPTVSGNKITTTGCGIHIDNYEINAPDMVITGNTIDFNIPLADKTAGVTLTNVKNPDIIVSNNNISNGLAGILLYAILADNNKILTIEGGNLNGNMIGVLVTNVDNNLTPAALKSSFIVKGINISKSKTYGVYVLGGLTADGGINAKVENCNITDSGDDAFTFKGFENPMDFAGVRVFGETNLDVSLTVENSVITGNMRGIGVNGGGNVLINGNTISSRDVSGAASIAFRISDSSTATAFTDNVMIKNNFISSPQRCILLQNQNSGSALVFFNNSFEGIGSVDLQNSIRNIDASGNWWGSNLQADVLAKATSNIDFTPWLNSAADTDVAIGFQGDFSYLNTGLDGIQTGSLSRLQEGHNLLIEGGTLNAFAANYTGTLEVAKDMFLANTASTQIENLIMNGLNKNLNLVQPFDISGKLTLTNGYINTTTLNTLTLLNNVSAVGGSDLSFVNGPLKAINTDAVFTSMNFPIGKKGTGFRNATIDFTQINDVATIYTAEYFVNGAPALAKIAPLSSLWDAKSFWLISNGGISNYSNPKLTLTYGPNDAYIGSDFVIAGSEPNPASVSWMSKSAQNGIIATSGNITTNTTISFFDSKYVIAPTAAMNNLLEIVSDPLSISKCECKNHNNDNCHNCHENCKTANFSVTATGENLSYQWQENGKNIYNGWSFSGTNTANLIVFNITKKSGYTYRCIVCNISGCVTSNIATLTINKAPEITQKPKSQCATSGSSASFNITANGTGITYKWQINGKDITDGTLYSGSATPTLTIADVTGLNNKQFRVEACNECGCVKSTPAKLLVKEGCKPPTNLRSSEITSNTAKIIWNGNKDNKKYEVSIWSNDNSYKNTFSTINPMYYIHKLKSNTTYNWKVRTICYDCGCNGSNSTSEWSETKTFKTSINGHYYFKSVTDNTSSNNDMSIYPNPSSSYVYISLPAEASNSVLTIYNLSGQLVYSENITSINSNTIKQLDLSAYQQGVYLVRFNNDQMTKTIKLILQ